MPSSTASRRASERFVIYTSGFAEAGEAGRALQEEIATLCRGQRRLRFSAPTAMGSHKTTLTAFPLTFEAHREGRSGEGGRAVLDHRPERGHGGQHPLCDAGPQDFPFAGCRHGQRGIAERQRIFAGLTASVIQKVAADWRLCRAGRRDPARFLEVARRRVRGQADRHAASGVQRKRPQAAESKQYRCPGGAIMP